MIAMISEARATLPELAMAMTAAMMVSLMASFFFLSLSLSLSFLSSLALCSLAGGPAGRIPVPWTMAAAGRSAAEVAEAAAGHVYLGDLEDVHSVASSTALPTNAVSEIPVLFLDSAIAFPGQVCR